MKILILLFIFSVNLAAQADFQAPVIPAEEGKLYNEIITLRSSDPQKALAKFAALPENHSPAFDFLQAVILIDLKLEKRAETFLKLSLKKLPTFYQARLTLAQILMVKSDFKAALPELLEVVKLGRADGQIWKYISTCHYEMKNYGAAESALNQAKIFLPEDESLDSASLNIYMQLEKYEFAEKLAANLVDRSPDNKNYWSIYIQCLLANNRQKKALYHQEILTRLFKPDNSDLKLLADLYFNEQVYLKAASIYLKIEGQLAGRSLLQAAQSYSYTGEYAEALAILTSVKGLSPSEKENFYTLKGQTHLNLNQPEPALKCFLEALKYNSENSFALFSAGELYEKLNEMDRALDFYSRAAKNSRYFISAKLRKARIHISLNENMKALQEVKEVMRTDKSKATLEFYNYLQTTIQ